MRRGAIDIAPTVTNDFWCRGFGQTLKWKDNQLTYRMSCGRMTGQYAGLKPLTITCRLDQPASKGKVGLTLNGKPARIRVEKNRIRIILPPSDSTIPCRFEVSM